MYGLEALPGQTDPKYSKASNRPLYLWAAHIYIHVAHCTMCCLYSTLAQKLKSKNHIPMGNFKIYLSLFGWKETYCTNSTFCTLLYNVQASLTGNEFSEVSLACLANYGFPKITVRSIYKFNQLLPQNKENWMRQFKINHQDDLVAANWLFEMSIWIS